MDHPNNPTTSSALPALLTDLQAAKIWGIGRSAFHLLRAAGHDWFPPAVQLGPRTVRYARADVEAAVAKMPRRAPADTNEPTHLRRARIEAAKAGRAAA